MPGFLIERPIAASMAFFALICLGLVASSYLPVNLLPDVDIPRIAVQVSAPAYSAREIDTSIMKPLRMHLMQANKLEDFKVVARNGSGTINLEFEYGTNIDLAYIIVNELVDKAAPALPPNVARPVVIKASASDIPVFYLDIFYSDSTKRTGVDLRSNLSGNAFFELSSFADEVVRRRIEQIQQVAMADITGRAFPEVIITPKMETMKAMNLPIEIIENAIRDHTNTSANLNIRDKQFRFNLRYQSRLTNVEDIGNLTLMHEGRLWQLKDLCQVEIVGRGLDGKVFSQGQRAISIAIIKQSDAPMRQLKNELQSMVAELKMDYPQLEFLINRDQTALLDYTMSNLKTTLLIGASLAFFVMMLFIGDFKSPWLIVVSVPAALIIAMLFFYLAGISLNIISISGLILCTGMMIDNAIIVIDNINRHHQSGQKLFIACVNGTREVFRPLVSSMLTTCSVFIPLIFLGGLPGALFFDQAMAITIGLFVSLVLAICIVPVYYHFFFWKQNSPQHNFSAFHKRPGYRAAYEYGFRFIMRHQYVVWIICLLLTGGITILYSKIDKSRFPDMQQSAMLLWVDWNEPLHINENKRRINQLLDGLDAGAVHTNVQLGLQQYQIAATHNNDQQQALIYLLTDSPDALEKAREASHEFFVGNYPKAIFVYENDGNLFDYVFENRQPTVEMRFHPSGYRERRTQSYLYQTINNLQQQYPSLLLYPIPSQPIISLKVDMEMLALYDVEYQMLQRTVKRAFNKNHLTTLFDGSLHMPVKSGVGPDDLNVMLQQEVVTSRNRVDVPLRLLLEPNIESDFQFFVSGREGAYYPVVLEIDRHEVPGLKASVMNVLKHDDYFDVSFAGSLFADRKHFKQLLVTGIIALLLLFFILSAQFESLKLPFIVLAEVPLAVFGALFMLWLFGESLNIMSLIGLVVMAGIIINDSILKIDTINRLRNSGMTLTRALYTAGQYRLKPILITSITTICALIPFLFVGGLGGDLQKPLALAVIGGLGVGTFISLYFIPVFYYFLYKTHKKAKLK